MGKRSDFERIPRDGRFWSKVAPPGSGGCRLWTGSLHRLGYGHYRLNGKIEAAHRVAFLLSQGRSPIGVIRHLCDTPACCEPSHLIEGTQKQNMEDCVERGRNRTPRDGNGYTKLTANDRASICARYAAGETNKSALAREFGVTPPRIRQVIQNG